MSVEKKCSESRIVYLAGPYTHSDPNVREARYNAVTAAAALLIYKGEVVFSPLTMTHPIDKLLAAQDETLGSDYWIRFDESFMKFCTELVVLTIDGWRVSSGVRREVEFFEDRGRLIRYMTFNYVNGKRELIEVEKSSLQDLQERLQP